MTKIRESQDKVNFLSDARKFHDPDSGSSPGTSHVPHQPLITSSSRRKPSRDSGLLHDTRNGMGIQGNVLEDLPAREGPPESETRATGFVYHRELESHRLQIFQANQWADQAQREKISCVEDQR